MRRAGQYICAANCTGTVHVLDSSSLRLVRSWQAHSSVVTDMDARSDFLVTCGLSQRQQHGLMHDPLANVFDLKSLSPLPPIPFQPGAAFVRMHPKMSTTSIVASQTGQLQVVDLMNPHTVNLKQAHIYDNNFLTGIELAPTGEALALASSMFQIHLWGSPSRIKFAEYGHPTVFADNITNDQNIDWSEDIPLNTVGMPYYREVLLSAWPSAICEVGGVPPKIEPDLLSQMKRGEIGYYGPNIRKPYLNQIEYTRIEGNAHDTIVPPKFLSEKARETDLATEEDKGFNDAVVSLTEMKIEGAAKKEVPHLYRNVEIKYSKFGVDDFDFE
jgi:PAB-dependent poly(A)-specific ribonuclease subunit 2